MIEKLVFVDKFLFSADIRCAKKANKLYLLLYFDPILEKFSMKFVSEYINMFQACEQNIGCRL